MSYNFVLSGGGLMTLTNSGGSYFIKWSERVFVIPVKAASSSMHYNFVLSGGGLFTVTNSVVLILLNGRNGFLLFL